MPRTAYYLKLDSGKSQIIGTSRDRYHVGWIKLDGFRPWEEPRFGNSSGGPGKVTIRKFVLTRLADRTSMELYTAANEARYFMTADMEAADEKTGIPKLRFSFTDVTLEAFSYYSTGDGGDPGETFTFNFAAMKLNHNPIPEESVGDILQSAFRNSCGLAPAQSAGGQLATSSGSPVSPYE